MSTEAAWKAKREEAAAYIRSKCDVEPQIGLILGSGLGALADEITSATASPGTASALSYETTRATVIPYRDIPHFPISTVAGHAGELVIGELEGKRVMAMKGRIHYYEGYTMQQLAFPAFVMIA